MRRAGAVPAACHAPYRRRSSREPQLVPGSPRPPAVQHKHTYRKDPRITRTFSTKILTSKLGVRIMWVYLYMCGYVEKYHICGLKVGGALYVGMHYTWVFTVMFSSQGYRKPVSRGLCILIFWRQELMAGYMLKL